MEKKVKTGNCNWTKTASASASESLYRWCWSDV